jgi:hypothetical protein
LRGALLRGALLRGALLRGALLRGALLRGKKQRPINIPNPIHRRSAQLRTGFGLQVAHHLLDVFEFALAHFDHFVSFVERRFFEGGAHSLLPDVGRNGGTGQNAQGHAAIQQSVAPAPVVESEAVHR